ncbi:S8 family serine peptidase [Oryzobacter sp. R7]|uniref:S8 family serine peptidase n=1 Tax=Oryzobacter faecalis TaxID=3388656 RepID=UPI00398D1730
MSTPVRLSTAGAAAVLAAAALLAAAPAGPAGAAPAPGPAAGESGHVASSPGKGDRDRDGVADDLAAAVARASASDRVGVIVQGTTPGAARRAAPSIDVGTVYRSFTGFSATVTAAQVRALSRVPGVTRVELDGVARALDASGNLDYGVVAARATGAASDGDLDGDGVGICVVDTGIDPNHEQLAGRVVGWRDWVNARTTPYDDHGHGTHVSGIAAGRPVGSADAPYGGVAPGASLIGAKVLNSAGSGSDANVVAAIEWCAARPDVSVISMSLGSPGSDGSDAGSVASNAAVAAGKVVVVAAGNSGDAPGTISSPGVATDVVTVGAASDPSSLAGASDSDTSLYLAGFSSRGPTTNPAAPVKPDVVAPGLSVVAARANTVSSYATYSGTSMATPFVSGVVALGLEAAPGASPAAVKAALRSSARDAGAPGPDTEWGAGLVDARAFLSALVPTLAAGTAPWADHLVVQGSVASGAVQTFPVTVTSAGRPLGVTVRTANGAATCVLPVGTTCWYGHEWAPDLDAYLVSPSGSVVAMSRCMLEATNGNCAAPGRFETLGVASAAAGTWGLRVESFSGAGSFVADVFGAVGAAEPPPPPPPPAAPTGFSATATSSSAVSLAWTDASSDETGFDVERCTGPGCTGFAPRTSPAAGSTSFSDTGLDASTTYGYRIRSVRGADVSAWTGPVYATTQAAPPPPPPETVPDAPTGLTASALSATAILLTWTDASSNEQNFRIERCLGGRCTPSYLTTVPAGTTSYTDGGLVRSTTFRYRLQACNAVGCSAYTPIVTVKTRR